MSHTHTSLFFAVIFFGSISYISNYKAEGYYISYCFLVYLSTTYYDLLAMLLEATVAFQVE